MAQVKHAIREIFFCVRHPGKIRTLVAPLYVPNHKQALSDLITWAILIFSICLGSFLTISEFFPSYNPGPFLDALIGGIVVVILVWLASRVGYVGYIILGAMAVLLFAADFYPKLAPIVTVPALALYITARVLKARQKAQGGLEGTRVDAAISIVEQAAKVFNGISR